METFDIIFSVKDGRPYKYGPGSFRKMQDYKVMDVIGPFEKSTADALFFAINGRLTGGNSVDIKPTGICAVGMTLRAIAY
jgi:hypothetical protein